VQYLTFLTVTQRHFDIYVLLGNSSFVIHDRACVHDSCRRLRYRPNRCWPRGGQHGAVPAPLCTAKVCSHFKLLSMSRDYYGTTGVQCCCAMRPLLGPSRSGGNARNFSTFTMRRCSTCLSTKKRLGAFATPKSWSCLSEALNACCCEPKTAFGFIFRKFVLALIALAQLRFLRHMDDVQSRLKKMDMKTETAEGILKRYKEIGLPNW
jgi:hypothetical protein